MNYELRIMNRNPKIIIPNSLFLILGLLRHDRGGEAHRPAFYLFVEAVRDSDAFQELVEVSPGFFVHRFFPAAEHYFDPDFIAFGEEFFRLCLFEKKIVRGGPEADTDTLGLDFFLFGFGLLFLLGLAVLELAEIGHLADRRDR